MMRPAGVPHWLPLPGVVACPGRPFSVIGEFVAQQLGMPAGGAARPAGYGNLPITGSAAFEICFSTNLQGTVHYSESYPLSVAVTLDILMAHHFGVGVGVALGLDLLQHFSCQGSHTQLMMIPVKKSCLFALPGP